MAVSIRRAAPRQFTFILRLWETRSIPPDPPATWCASLEDVNSGLKRGFSNLETLIVFLNKLQDGVEDEIEGTALEQEGKSR